MQRSAGEDQNDFRRLGEEAVPVGIITLDGRLPSYPPPLQPHSHPLRLLACISTQDLS